MPERPDLENWIPRLREAVVGRRVKRVRVVNPIVLRAAVDLHRLADARITAVDRHGPFVKFTVGDVEIVIHPMLAGRFSIAGLRDKTPADVALGLPLDNDTELRYRDDRQMGKVYVVPAGEHASIAGYEPMGIDVLDPATFTREAFLRIAKGRREQVKAFLLDHSALDTFGNAYADETLWEAGIHPKLRVNELSPEQLDRLFVTIPNVLIQAREEIAARNPPLEEKVRDFLAVRRKKGEACPRCGTAVRVCGMRGYDAFFCPKCQPDSKGRSLVDWSRLG